MKYYEEQIVDDFTSVRVFLPGIEYPWHRDAEDRIIKVLETGGLWKFQKDNELPVELKVGEKLKVKSNSFHRLISGTGTLVLQITKIV